MTPNSAAPRTAARQSAEADALLAWYDRSARLLPWRTPPGSDRRPDPYRVWLSEIMLQQTTVATVIPYYAKFTDLWPTVQALAVADRDAVLSAWAGLGYYARARNLHACAQAVTERWGGAFPDTEAELLTLPGIGAYTAAAIAAIAFDRHAAVVDGNVERVISRLQRIESPLPGAKPEIRAAVSELTPTGRPGDFAQAMMDLGATICTPKKPACGVCPWLGPCAAQRAGVAETLPKKTPKPVKPTRRGVAYLAVAPDGRALFERRPDAGLLGGMLGLPGGPWSDAADLDPGAPPAPGAWRDLAVEARHTFTHFHLRLALRGAHVESTSRPDAVWLDREAAEAAALPTVMRKALRLGWDALEKSGGPGADRSSDAGSGSAR